MSFEYDGNTIETNANGHLDNVEDWNKGIAAILAAQENIELTDKHWDVMNFLREEYIENAGNQPNARKIVKAMSEAWGEKLSQRDVYELFPGDPSKQGGKVAGLPESRRKGGY